jgi:hypothetical protein
VEKLFYDKETRHCVVVTNKTLFCSGCKEILPTYFMVQRSYSKILPAKESFFCSKCGSKNIKRDLDFFSMARIERRIKASFNLITDYAPELRKGELDLFAASNLQSEKVEDKTAYSHYESWEGAKIGNDDFKDIDRVDKLPYPEVQIDKFLKQIQESKPIIPKQLEAL